MDKDTTQQYYIRIKEEIQTTYIKALKIGDYIRIKEEIQTTYIKALKIGDYTRNGFGKGNIRKIKRLEKSYNEVLDALQALKEKLIEELECKNNL